MEDKEKNQPPQQLNIIEKIKWTTVREFFAFIFASLMYIQNKQLVKDIQTEKQQDKEYSRQEKKEQNQMLEKVILTMDDVIKYKQNDKDDSIHHFINHPANSDR